MSNSRCRMGRAERNPSSPAQATVGFTPFYPPYELRTNKRREAERRQTRVTPPARKHGARVAPRSRRLAPPFPLSGALACRRSTTALIPATCHLWAQLRPCFLGRGLNGRYPLPCPSPVSTSRAGPSAGRLMPEPPGSGADEAPPAGTALAPAARHHPDGVP